MNKLKKSILESSAISEIYEDLDRFMTLLEDSKYEGINIMTDYFGSHLKINENVFSREFNQVLGELIGHFNNKESIIEQLPSQFTFKDDFKTKFIKLLPISEKEIVDIITEWNVETAKKFDSKETSDRTIKEMYAISFPYMYLALTVKKEELSMNILMMLNMLMYSMAYAQSFPKFNYNRDKGQYVIQNVLKNKGFGKYNSIYDLMMKVSEDTRKTYVAKELSDRVIYEAIWSNMQTKMKYYMKQFHEVYQNIGSVYLTTNKDIISTADREGNSSTVETNIESDSAVILRLSKDVSNYISNPSYIENTAIKVALNRIMGIDVNNNRGSSLDKKSLVERNVYAMIEEIQKTNDFEVIISNILQNFLWEDGNTVTNIETPKFRDKIIYDLSYVGKNKIYINNIIRLLDIHINKVLYYKGKSTETIDNKTLQKYRKTIIYYFALLTQTVSKRN